MRGLFHPHIDDVTVEQVLYALSDPIRANIYLQIAAAECPQTCSAFLKFKDQTIPKSTLSQHFKVLRECGLIRSEKMGVELRNTTRCDELHERFGNLLQAIVEAHRRTQTPSKPTKRNRK